MLSNITSRNRGKITVNRELGRSSQELHIIETDLYPRRTYQLNNLNISFNTKLKSSEAAYRGIYQHHKFNMHCYFKTF